MGISPELQKEEVRDLHYWTQNRGAILLRPNLKKKFFLKISKKFLKISKNFQNFKKFRLENNSPHYIPISLKKINLTVVQNIPN